MTGTTSTRPLTTRPLTTRPLTTRPLTTRPLTTRPLTSRPRQVVPYYSKVTAGPLLLEMTTSPLDNSSPDNSSQFTLLALVWLMIDEDRLG